MKLHCHPISPYARKVMILARLHDMALEEVSAEADGVNGYTGGANPLGKIPALERDGQVTLFDSPVICDYLDRLSQHPLLLEGGETRFVQLRLHALGDGLADAVYNYRYETVRPDALHWEQLITRHTQAIKNTIAAIARDINALGTDWSYGNLAIICALDYASFRAPHVDWRALHPKLADWHKPFTQHPAYQETYAYTE